MRRSIRAASESVRERRSVGVGRPKRSTEQLASTKTVPSRAAAGKNFRRRGMPQSIPSPPAARGGRHRPEGAPATADALHLDTAVTGDDRGGCRRRVSTRSAAWQFSIAAHPSRAFRSMALLGMQDVSIAFGGPPILDRAAFAIERGERVCLLGRNGAGKSTIMKLLDGTVLPDSGEIVRQTGVSLARREQEIPGDIDGTTFDVVAAGLGETGRLLARYHAASHRVGSDASGSALRELDRLHHALDIADAWQVNTRVETVLVHLGLDA